MLSANDARKYMADQEPGRAEIKKIENAIKAAATEGKDFIWHYDLLSNSMTNLLESMGYSIDKQYDQRENGWLIKISWAS